MTVLIDRVGYEVDAIDVFCGYGGSSQGIHAAGANVLAAANHSALALECHAANFPGTEHWQADLVSASDPQVLNAKGQKVPGRYLDPADLPRARFAWFSPACTHHSQANSKKVFERGLQQAMFDDEDWAEQEFVNSERSRVTMSCVLRYVDRNHPEIVCVENVVEVTKWGPNKDGSTFRWWMTELRNLDYEVKVLFLTSMFFGRCPQSRDRVYVVAWRKGNVAPDLDYRPTAFCTSDSCGGQIVGAVQTFKPRTRTWMLDEWGKYGAQYVYACPTCKRPVDPASWMAISAIDFSIVRPTLEERIAKQGMPAENTWERLRRAYAKFYYAPPVVLPNGSFNAEQIEYRDGSRTGSLVEVTHGEGVDRNRHVTEHLSTLTAKNGIGVALHGSPVDSVRVAVVSNYGAASGRGRAADGTFPFGTITVRGTQQSVLAIVVPNRTNNEGKYATDQIAPVMAGTVSQGVVLAGAGNTSERENPDGSKRQTRARSADEPMFTQTATAEYGFAAMPVLRGTADSQLDGASHASGSLHSIAAGGGHNTLLTAFTQKFNGGPAGAGNTTPHALTDQLGTLTAGGKYGIDPTGLFILPTLDDWEMDSTAVTESLAVATALTRAQLRDLPPYEGEITDEMLMQVRWGMLEPDPELRRGMDFADDYILLGTKTQMTAGLGNAVTPGVPKWLVEQCMATLRGAA